ncbi:matrixin family metalloprotease [Nocardioides sp.]|uniref:matrixin family metalloprotease n=1 Tax=Nocardioides sp. TaxID=35761 RepID=UPI002D7E755E|nr:matrixin family metalloprotease [Nocardioides sp.]
MAIAAVPAAAWADRPETAANSTVECGDTLRFDEATAYASLASECETPPATVTFDDQTTLLIPTEPGSSVHMHVDAATESDSAEYSAHLTEDGQLVTAVDDDQYGTDDAITEADAVVAQAGEGHSAHGPHASRLAEEVAGKKAAKLEAATRRAEESEPVGSQHRDIPAASENASSSAAAANWSAATKCGYTSHVPSSNYQKMGTDEGGYRNIQWYYNPAGEPTIYTDAQYRTRIKSAADSWDVLWNNCNINVSWPNIYMDYRGTTSAAAGCSTAPPVNVVGWATISDMTTVARACRWNYSDGSARFSIQNNRGHAFYAGASETACSNRHDLEAIMVHEFGHALGLDHSPQSSSQVMRPTVHHCESYHRYLGRGDIRGVRAIYGVGFWN